MPLVHSFLETSAQRYPDKTALVHHDQRLTYAEFETQANTLAAGLVERGVKRGDRVIIWRKNSIETCVSIFAALKAGAAFVVIDPSTKKDKFLRLVKDCRPAAIVTDDRSLSQIQDTLWSITPGIHAIAVGDQSWSDFQIHQYSSILAEQVSAPPPVRCIDRDLAALIYTSGSTGVPKGVMSAHYNIVSAASAITQYLENVPDDIIIDVLPLAFDYGLYQLLMACLIGGTLVLESSFAFPVQTLDVMRQEHVTGFPGVPSMFSILLQLDPQHLHLPDLRYVSNTGAALPVQHIQQLRAILGEHVRIYSMYGQTECKRTLYLPPAELDQRPGSVGIPIPNEEVFVVDPEGNEVPPGEVGELVVRGANVMLGYWEKPEETARTFVPGPLPGERLLRTGDLFWRDSDGFLYFVSRTDDIIKCRGQKVSPKEIVEVLYQLEGISEATVIGVEHEVWGEVIHAHVVLKPDVALSEAEIIKHCRGKLEDFMVPERVVFHETLPKTSSGKIDNRALPHVLDAV